MNDITHATNLITKLEHEFKLHSKLTIRLLDNRHIMLSFDTDSPTSVIYISTVDMQKLLGEFTKQLQEAKAQLQSLKNETK